MLRFCLKISILMCFATGHAQGASTIRDGELIVTLRDTRPCFSYPLDDSTRMTEYYFGYMSITWNERESYLPGHKAWFLEKDVDGKNLIKPHSADTCVVYGEKYPGAQEKDGPAKLLREGLPYNAHMTVFAEHSNRKYETWFCLSRDTTGAIVLLKAERNRATSKYECVPPEKIDKRGFFDRLFGKGAP